MNKDCLNQKMRELMITVLCTTVVKMAEIYAGINMKRNNTLELLQDSFKTC